MIDSLATSSLVTSPGALAFLILSALAAGLARGFSGFGAAMIFVPLASSVLGPQVAVPLLLVIDGVMTLGLIPNAVKNGEHRDILTMALGSAVSIPVGIYLLATLDPSVVRWAIVVAIAALLALLMSGWRYHGRPKPILTVLVGMVAGLFSGVAQIGGPPVVAYWLGGATPLLTVRANFILYFALSTVLSAIGYLWGGLITGQIFLLALITAPLYGVGVWIGCKMFGWASDRTFRHICYGMIGFAVIASMPILDSLLR